jgi:hypothetical protein
MKTAHQRLRRWMFIATFSAGLISHVAWGQSTFKAQLLGVARDNTGAVISNANVTITNEATGVSLTTKTDSEGRYIFNNLAPASYQIKAEAEGFRPFQQQNIVLRVAQESVLDLKFEVGSVASTIEVSAAPVLLNDSNAELGQEVTSRYITEVPLFDRDISNLVYLTPGVTEAQGFQANQTHENFVSNGQRNSSAEVRLDGGLTSTPEAGEGAMFWAHYQPSIEIVQEFKVQTNSFSAEYGSNGGTVINMVTKSGTNAFHGSGYWYGRRSQTDAKNWFSTEGNPAPEYSKNIYGASVGGPIVKDKLFFFGNYDRQDYHAPQTVVTTVPTDLQKQGDFSQTFVPDAQGNPVLDAIYNPFNNRTAFTGNVIPSGMLNQLALNLMALYPEPTGPGDQFGQNNYTVNLTNAVPQHQYNARVDYVINSKNTWSTRYSKGYLRRVSPTAFVGALGQGDEKNDYNNVVTELDHAFSPKTLLTLRAGLDRHYQNRDAPKEIDPTSLGFPSILVQANGQVTFPRIDVSGYQSLGLSGWTKTIEAQSNFLWDAAVSKVVGPHNFKFGAEQRILLSNFFQPAFPGGQFGFDGQSTRSSPNSSSSTEGNAIASLLLDFGSYSGGNGQGGQLSIHPEVFEKSGELAFFAMDDWKVNSRLTVNLGLRYERSTPYDERFDRIQFANFTGDTGMTVDLSGGDPFLQGLGLGPTDLHGIAQFANSSRRHVGPDNNNFGPRLGVAYRLGQKTVFRGGAGVYYGVNPATSYQDVGAAFRKTLNWRPSIDNGQTLFATLENPFPAGLTSAQGNAYGSLNMWGFTSDSNQSSTFRNSEIYQWSLSVQHELPGNSVVEAAYSANRSTHLPYGGSKNRNFISSALLSQISAQQHALDPTCDADSCVTSYLNQNVTNPFLSLFSGGNAIFNEPDSPYAQSQIPLIDLLRPYPQFSGNFEGFNIFRSSATYNSLQLKYEKRYSAGLNLEGSYTLAKETDDASFTSNGWLGNSTSIQLLDQLHGEQSVGASDVRHRVAVGGSYELPFGHGKRFGHATGSLVNGIFGGWQTNFYLTIQSGLPLYVYMSNGRIADGSQRPNVSGDPRSHFSIQDVAEGKGNYFNFSAFSDPGDQIPGNGPRFNSALRGDEIRNLDFSIIKNVGIREGMNLQLRTEFFNFTNTPRFLDPNTAYGGSSFGTITGQANNPRQVQFGAKFTF